MPRNLGCRTSPSAVAAVLLALACSPRISQADSTWTDHYRAARAAYEAGDFARSRDGMAQVRTMIGEQPGVAYHLARAEARLGNGREALTLLNHYAASGMARDVASDSAFAALFTDTTFQRLAAAAKGNRRAVGSSARVHTFSANDLLIEDVAHDPKTGDYYVTSVTTGAVLRVVPGRSEQRVDALSPGNAAAFAIGLDTQRRWLWLSYAATPTCRGYAIADSGRSWLQAFDLASGKVVRTLEVPRDGRPHVLGDLTVTARGEVFVTDSRQGGLYRVAPGGLALEPWFTADELRGAQSPAMSADGQRVYVAQYGVGLSAVDARTRAIRRLTFAPGIAVQGIDGLYVLDARTLLAVQNGTDPQRLVRLRLDSSGTHVEGWQLIEQGTEGFAEPNHGVRVGNDFMFINASGWDRVGADEQLAKDPKAPAPELRRVSLR